MLLTRSPLNLSRSPSRVRLACVRHAASVDSEPGSNSHVKSVDRSARPYGRPLQSILINASADDLALCLRCYLVLCRRCLRPCGFLQRSSPNCLRNGLTPFLERRTQLTLDGSIKYLHALSSFQRTEQAPSPEPPFQAPAPTCRTFRPVLGEPSKVTSRHLRCQAHCLQRDPCLGDGKKLRRGGGILSDVASEDCKPDPAGSLFRAKRFIDTTDHSR